MKKIRYILFLLALSVVSLTVQAQKSISGVVTDEQKIPVIGATVIVSGTVSGTTTDARGEFSIALPAGKDQITISYVGYTTQTIEAGGRTRIDVILQSSTSELDEVVVVGYGTMRKSDLTGSLASVKIDDLEAARTTSFDQLLQGRAAGVQVTSSSFAPGASVDIKIRGTATFNGGREPLYIVDGVMLNPPTLDSGSTLSATNVVEGSDSPTNGLMGINPQDIASMEILKDASATAIYGSMGANGVVLITTKQGVSERPTVSWTSNISISSPNKRIPMMSFDEYLEYQWWREDNGIGAGGVLETIYKDYTKPRDELEFVDGIVPMDWQDYVMGTSVSHNHRVSISGSSKTSNYLIAAGFSDSKGIIRQTGVKQTDMRFSYNRTLSKYIRIGTRASLAQVTTNMMQGGVANSGSNASMMRSMLSFRPFYNFQKEGSMLDDPDMADDAVSSGPPLWFKDFADRSAEIRILPSAYLEFTPLKWLTYKFSIGGDYLSRERSRWKGPLINNTGNRAIAGVNEGLNIRYNIDNMLMFNHEFNGGHRLSGTIGTTFMNALSRNLIVEGWNTVQYIPQFDNINSAPDTRYGYLDTQNAIISYLGRAVYSFRDRYVLTATYRVDGSSKFSKNNRYSSFPSFALAWRATEEKWLGSLKDVASVKFRFGWGRVGNEGLRPYQTKAEYAINSDTRYPDHSYGNLSEGITGSVPAVLANPDLIWETSEQSNVGADIGFFDNRLSLTVDLYKKLTRDLLQEMSLSSIAGFETMWMNRGEIENKGIEFSLDARIIDNEDFSWDFGVNGSFNRNKILYVGLPPQGGMAPYFSGEIVGSGNYLATPVNIFMEGQPMGVFYGYKTDGLVPVGQTGVKLSADGAPIPEGGINYVLSEKNDGGVLNPNLDRTILGNPNPDFVYGFNTSMRYKNLALSMNFNGVQGVDVVNVNRVMEENTGLNAFNIRRDAFYKQWTPENQNTVYPRVGVVQSGESSNFLTDRFVEDASYLRLANVTLSCDIPLKKKKFVQSINVNASVQNAFVITDYSGWDPEVNSFGSDLMRMGADMGSYPNARTYSFGISMNF